MPNGSKCRETAKRDVLDARMHLQFISCFIHTPNIFHSKKSFFFISRRLLRTLEKEGNRFGQMRIMKDAYRVYFSIKSLVVRARKRSGFWLKLHCVF